MNEPLPRYRISRMKVCYGREDETISIETVSGERLLDELDAYGVHRRWLAVGRTPKSATRPCHEGEYIAWESIREDNEMPKLPQVSQSAPLNGTKRAEAKPATCGCLCGAQVGPKSTFRQGHDQRMIGELSRLVVEGTLTNEWVERLQLPTEVDDKDIEIRIQLATKQVAGFYTEALARKFDAAARRYWEKIGKERPKKSVESVDESRAIATAEELSTKPPMPLEQVEREYTQTLGAPVRVKVGRWEYDATIHGMSQAGKVTAVRYYNKDEKEFVKTEGQFTILPA